MALDFDELAVELRHMKRGSRLYELVKAEMVYRGKWTIKPRGKPFKTGHDERRSR